MTRLVTALLVVLSVAFVAACGSDDDGAGKGGSTSTQASGGDRAKIAIGTSVTLKSGYGKALQDGIDRIKHELRNEVAVAQLVKPSQMASTLQDFATRGYKLVMLDGADWQQATLQVAPKFPDTKFIVVNGFQAQKPNVAAVDFEFEQSGFLAGVVAGLATKSDQVGAVGGMEIPPLQRLFAGYEQGVKHVNKAAKVTVSYIGSWTDPEKASTVTQAQLSKGVDVVWGVADTATAGIFGAADGRGATVIGYGVDDSANAPGNMLTTATVDYASAFYDVTKQFDDGKFEPVVTSLGFDQGVLGLAPFGSAADEAVASKAEAIAKQAQAGEIRVEKAQLGG